jgi:pyruvate-formate lyase-activating enzyme
LRCSWCDSPGTWLAGPHCRVELAAGSGEFQEQANPIDAECLDSVLGRLDPMPGSFISLTGGEPLLQPQGVAMAAAVGRSRRLRPFLETHGLEVEALESVIDEIDHVSMDWKLESDVRYADEEAGNRKGRFAARHAEFLARAGGRAEVSVKVVLTRNTTLGELERVSAEIASIAPKTPLILQPVTPSGRVRQSPEPALLLESLRFCERILEDVRLIPQTHRLYGVL